MDKKQNLEDLADWVRTLGSGVIRYSLRRYAVDEFSMRCIPETSEPVLDLGGHRVQKRGRFDLLQIAPGTVCLNLTPEKAPDVLGDGAKLPFTSQSFSGVVCTELLEHVENPAIVIQEASRVLKPGGWIRMTVPFLYWIHGDPYDFGRYTDSYWRKTLERCGFVGIEIEKQGGYFSVLFEMIRETVAKENWDRGSEWKKRLLWRIFRWAKLEAIHRDALPKYRQHAHYSRFCTGFGISARKESK